LKKVGVDGQVSVVSFINGGTLADPYGLAIDGQDNLYITDGADLKVMTPNGNLSVAASLPVSTISMGIVSISPDGQRIIALGRGFSDPYLFTPDSFVGTVSLGSSQYTNTRPAIDTDRTIYYTNNYSSGRSINRLL